MIENEQVYISYVADGTQRQWEWPYQYFDTTDINLFIMHDNVLTQISPSLYSFNESNKKITYPSSLDESPIPAGDIVLISRGTDVTQLESSLITNFKSNDVERMADKLTMICQELHDSLNRSIHYNQVDAATGETDATQFANDLKQYTDESVSAHNIDADAHSSKFASKQDVIDDLSTIRSNASKGKDAYDTMSTYGSIVTHDATEFATLSQLNNSLATKQDTLSTAQIAATNSGITTAGVNQIGTNTNSIASIEGKIPTQATTQNQLADKNFVNSTVNSLAAFYITSDIQGDPFATKAALLAGPYYSGGETRVLTRNDYALVVADETHDDNTSRFLYDGEQWVWQYTINNTQFTAAQIAALNSGITDTLVTQIGTNTTAISGKQDTTLSSSIVVEGTTETTVEGALGAIASASNKSVKTDASPTLNAGNTYAFNFATTQGNTAKLQFDSTYGLEFKNSSQNAGNELNLRNNGDVQLKAGSNGSIDISAGNGSTISVGQQYIDFSVRPQVNNTDVALLSDLQNFVQADSTTGLIAGSYIPYATSSTKGGLRQSFDNATATLTLNFED